MSVAEDPPTDPEMAETGYEATPAEPYPSVGLDEGHDAITPALARPLLATASARVGHARNRGGLPHPAEPLCHVEALPGDRAIGFLFGAGADLSMVLVVRDGDAVRGYVNRCPHLGTPLDWAPEGFLAPDGRHLRCSTHGALFRIGDGLCVDGPCKGKALTAVRLTIDDDGYVRLGCALPRLDLFT